ncbi:ABC transporter permease [Gaoshiqia sediminis]|uniref:ABC transporter permease n=1 Tax=Gaoshiqia sediminis TaxID=2986998 RepID=A0AA41Y2M7_9BACT|nr:ABC transporter permease [Gaoshiqia sediminis]MCW0482331.1 ABC transporter permease [Gaoshiqia sediminis]
MKISKSIKISRSQLLSNKLRTFFSLIGVIIGVSAVIIMVAIGNGAQNEVLSKIESMGTNLIIVNTGQVQKNVGRQQIRGTVTSLTLRDVDMLASECPDVRMAAPVQTKKMQVKWENLSTNTTITGTTSDYQAIRNFQVEKGNFFTEEEDKAYLRVAVLGQTVVNNLFDGRNPVGETIRIGRIPFSVIGVMEPKGSDLNGVDQDDQIFIPIQTALRRVFNLNYINTINVQAASIEEMDNATGQISEVLREQHRLNKQNKPDDFTIQNQIELLETQKETTGTFTALIVSTAGVSLLVGGIGILAIMLIAIRERINEIGLRMAVGASKKDILLQFVIESSILSIAGGIIGIVTGVLASVVIILATDWTLNISIPSIIYSFLFSLAVGLFFGVYPALKASRLDPIDALRSE